MSDIKKSKNELIEELHALRIRVEEYRVLDAERQAVQKALTESEQRYRSVFENTGTATIIIENDMTISMVNAKFESLTGYSKQEIRNKMKWTDFVAEEDIERMKRYHVKRRKDRSLAPTEYECRVHNRFNEYKDMYVRIDMIAGTLSSVGSFNDITVFKQTEKALIESERKLSKLMGNLPGMAYRCVNDFNRTMKYVSAGCKWLTDYSPFELIDNSKKAYMDMIHEDDRDDVNHQIQSSLSSGRPFQMEYRIITASGQQKWVWEEGLGIIADDGTVAEVEGFISDMTEHKLEEQQLRKENKRLKSTIKERYKFGDIIGKNRSMQDVYEHISMAAASVANVIIYGESGTGKELVAREIHKLSDNYDRPFVPVNCSAIPENLFESEFFGYKKGAFTGAGMDKPGYFDQANGGTLFLDELGEIDLTGQVKLLRVLDGGGYTPVGSNEVKKAEVRIVAATNRDLKEEVKKGRMREDFFYRIHIIPITLPPLRERKDDLPLLIEHFLSIYATSDNMPVLDGKILGMLYNYEWPGNVRELQNVLQRYITLKTLDFMSTSVPKSVANDNIDSIDIQENVESLSQAMDNVEKTIIRSVLEKNQWRKNRVADVLSVNRKTLFRKMKKHDLL
ncbi:MAG: sigma 54-interacting transcriptional regulator [Desulfobacteraceae bacterium]|nr:sigma 54-interacting transcriptional regulator [Desulfobacteraceae bacterium]